VSLELYGAASCPYTRELRESLEWSGRDFIEYDVEANPEAWARLYRATGQRTVPVLMEDGKVLEIGWQGRGCVVVSPDSSQSSSSS
jgi:mycoredoxin